MHLTPTREELHDWLLQTAKHSLHVEYYLGELGVGGDDPERPHDIIGLGNKFESGVMEGFAMQYRERTEAHFQAVVLPSLTRHRCQYHHRMWNERNDAATTDALKLGAVDAICSLLEPRDYQGGRHAYEEIEGIIGGNPPHRQPWMREVLTEVRKIRRARLGRIASLDELANIGVPVHSFDIVRQRVEETRECIRQMYGHDI